MAIRERDLEAEPESGVDFFLPDLCESQSILLLVLVSILLVFVVELVAGGLLEFRWFELGLTSMFVLWVVLLSAALLCNLRPWLIRYPTSVATVIAYSIILVITALLSVAGEFFLAKIAWAREHQGGWTLRATANVLRNLIIAAIMTGIAFRYFFLQNQLRQREKAELRSRVQALQSRIRPHFLFNSMNIIASLIPIDPDVAEEVVVDLSLLFRASLSDSTSQPVSLAEELELCRKYVHIEGLRLDDRLNVDWQVNVDVDDIRIPMLTLQPLLENAIYHGIQPRLDGGTVTVKIDEVDGLVTLVVTNPIAQEEVRHETGNRMAIENIRRRMEANYGEDARVESGINDNMYITRIEYRPDSAR